ncbi:MAG: RNA-guided endonuclease InsQ/TnpB family protein [Halobellus sp.]|uniref:RNA-guided endonuclease InsQ/TnpB family protein n=1 Tax=Halobellus sp. TaxID=1979212 RepID=UPI0035D460CA
MEVRRTVPVTLDVDSHDSALLHETVDEFLWAAQYVADYAFDGEYITTSKSDLHEKTYSDVRDQTRLHSNHVQAARNKATAACKSVAARREQGKSASKPDFTAPHVVYDHRSATFHDDYVSLATVEGRIEADYVLPENPDGTPHQEYLFSDAYEITGAELHRTDGEWQLHIRTRTDIESEPEATENRTVLGVDLGVNNLAVTSTGTFWSGDDFDHWRREYEKRRGDLQQCGTRWAHQNLAAVGRQESGRFKQLLHRISNELVEEALAYECSTIVFEDLTGIRDRTNASWGHKWAFERLYDYVEYKAHEHGLDVVQEEPQNTSQRCSECGFTHPTNRQGRDFTCQKCGYQNHADYNAAKNIGLRHLRRHQTGDGEGAPVGVRLNSGMLTASGDFTPADDSARARVHAESPRL